jgi:hypothetical protein
MLGEGKHLPAEVLGKRNWPACWRMALHKQLCGPPLTSKEPGPARLNSPLRFLRVQHVSSAI